MVERYLGVVEVARSNRVTQTIKSRIDLVSILLFIFCAARSDARSFYTASAVIDGILGV